MRILRATLITASIAAMLLLAWLVGTTPQPAPEPCRPTAMPTRYLPYIDYCRESP